MSERSTVSPGDPPSPATTFNNNNLLPIANDTNTQQHHQQSSPQQLVTPPPTDSPPIPSENTSLLRPNTTIDDNNYDSTSDDDDNLTKIVKLTKRPSFIWISCLGIIAIIIFNLTFLPRTSLARDYRRWHDIHLTKTDVKRDFLQLTSNKFSNSSISIENSINHWLLNLTKLQLSSDYNLLSTDNIHLTNYIISNFKASHLHTQVSTYDVQCKIPLNSNLQLLDHEQVVYQPRLQEPNSKTPAFFSNGHNGTINNDYVYVNEGLPIDYNLLKKNHIPLRDKIFIIHHDIKSNVTIGEKLKLSQLNGASGVLTFSKFDHHNDQNVQGAISRDHNSYNVSIPAIPVSEKIITPILQTLSTVDDEKFENWPYYPTCLNSNFKLRLETQLKNETCKLTNVIGTIKGIINDGDIIIGARRDSYTNTNPLSGHAIMLELIKSFNSLVDLGWKPLRNIKFISWDGSNMDSLGVRLFANESLNHPILSYINIDQDAIMGSHFEVDSNPMFNHVIKKTSKYISIPHDSSSTSSSNHDSTLYHYWLKQDNLTINNNLGLPLQQSDSLLFQQHLFSPVINLKFTNDFKRDNSVYIPNSNYYNYNWLMKKGIDEELSLHTTLVKFIGLLTISLSEHEVIDYKTNPYFLQIQSYYNQLLNTENSTLSQWRDLIIPNYLIYKSSIYQDLDTNEAVKFSSIINQLSTFLNESVYQSDIFDHWNVDVENGLIQDYPWYLYYKKLKHFAQFKVSNYKLSHLEKDFKLNDKDYAYLYLTEDGTVNELFRRLYYDSIIFGTPKLQNNQQFFTDRYLKSTLSNLYQSIDDENFEMTVKWLVLTYEKIKNLEYKMT